MILSDELLTSLACRRRGLLVAFLSGVSLVWAFAPYELPWLAPLSVATLLLCWERAEPGQAARSGLAYGIGMFVAGSYWLYVSLNILGGLWPPFALLLMLVLVLLAALFLLACGWLTVRLSPLGGWQRWLLVFPAVWTLLEWSRGWMVTGFPYLSLGYGQVETSLGLLAPLTGVYGISWIVALISGLLVACLRAAQPGRVASVAAIATVVFISLTLQNISWTQDSGRDFRVTLVQGAISQERKWLPEQLEPTLQLYRELSMAVEGQDLIVWPEAAIPALPFEVTDYVSELHAELVKRDTQLFAGILNYELDSGRYLNSLWALGAEPGMYYKRHLVMFGEYFPLPDFAKRWLRIMNLPSESIAMGADDQPLLVAKGIPVAVTICYEIAFGAEQLHFLPEAQLLVNVSNDAWFGDTVAPHQHLQMGQMRALETGRYLLRATNTGITAIVDPKGRVVERIPQFEPGVIRATVRPFSGATPYVRFGNWPVVTTAVFLLAVFLFAGLRNKA